MNLALVVNLLILLQFSGTEGGEVCTKFQATEELVIFDVSLKLKILLLIVSILTVRVFISVSCVTVLSL